MAIDAKHRKTRADRIAEKQEQERKKAEHEAELKRIRTEFLEKETSRIENEVRTKFEAIAEERDAARQIEEEAAAEIRESERLAREEAEAEVRVAARIAEEEKEAAEREAERLEARRAARIAALSGATDGKKKIYRAVRREPKGD
jgi:hypothetical protein